MTSKFDIPCSLLAIGLTLSPSIIPHLLRNRTFLVPCSLLGCHFLLLSFLIYFEIGHSLFLVRYWVVTFSFYHSSFTSKSDIPCSLFAIGLSLSPSIIPHLPGNSTFHSSMVIVISKVTTIPIFAGIMEVFTQN